jgi:exodeoxyribonuclease VII small subunit
MVRLMPKTRTPELASAVEPLPATYELAVQELEQLVSRLDAGQMPLDQLLDQYQRGAQLLALCRERLQAVEHQVKVLEAGELRPWVAD